MYEDLKDNWKKMITTLPEDSFFQVMNTWVGPIKTPFKKPPYVDKLINLISAQENIDRICQLLDSLDRSILSAIFLLKDATPTLIHEISCPHLSHLQFSFKIINLEERLLIYKLKKDNKTTIALNPYWLETLQQRILSIDAIFKPIDCQPQNFTLPWLEPGMIFSFLSFVLEKEPSIKQDYTWKKKSQDKMIEIFHFLGESHTGIDRKELVKGLLSALSCFKLDDDETLQVNPQAWKSLSDLSTNEIYLSMITAALYWIENKGPDELPTPIHPIETEKLQMGIDFFVTLIKALPIGNLYSNNDFIKIINLCAPKFLSQNAELTLKTLIEMEVVVTYQKHYVGINPIFDLDKEPETMTVSGIIESSFDLIIKPEISFKDGVFVAIISNLLHYDQYKRFTITKESYLRALKLGFPHSFIIKQLQRITGNTLPQNLIQNLEQWCNNYQRVRIIKGILLQISAQDAQLVKNNEELQKYIIQELAPNLYLMDEDNIATWQNALLAIGIQEIPIMERPGKKPIYINHYETLSLNHTEFKIRANQPLTLKTEEVPLEENPEFRAMEEKLKSLNLSAQDQEEVEARIRNRVFIFADQITPMQEQYKIREASGLDVTGKISVIKKAIENKREILEITPLSLDKNVQSELIFPTKLVKTGASYSLEGQKIEDNETVELSVNLIAKVKRLPSSLLGN